MDAVDREGSAVCTASDDRSSSSFDTDLADRVFRVDRVGGPDSGRRVDFVDVVRGAGLSDCGMILTCGLNLSVCVESADRVTGVYRVESEDVFEWTDRVETFSGVKGEEEIGEEDAPEARGRW